MNHVVRVFAVLLIIFGALICVQPQILDRTITRLFQTPTGLYVAAGIRLFLGVALCTAASTSRAPKTLCILGIIFIVAALSLPVIGFEKVRGFVEHAMEFGPGFFRAWGAMAVLFGGFLAYSVAPKSKPA
ncbi:MAG: hypothetical protein OER86_03740 [Phycisphaerae bacterium]|nr:hypothetical protein [Phycisphaerae bacterium]